METTKELSTIELQRKGIEALTKDLGMAGAIHFLQLFDKGSGDWTEERKTALKDFTIDDIVMEMNTLKK